MLQAAEALLAQERASNEALTKELAALRLVAAEGEQALARAAAAARDAGARAAKEAAAAQEAAQEAAGLRAELAAARAELASATTLQQGLLKELGVLSSRCAAFLQGSPSLFLCCSHCFLIP